MMKQIENMAGKDKWHGVRQAEEDEQLIMKKQKNRRIWKEEAEQCDGNKQTGIY